jgi:hypothetical protein
MGFSGSGAASGAMSGASAGAMFGPWGAVIGGVAGGVIGGVSGGAGEEAARTAANNKKKLALLENEKFILNAVLATYEAQRIQSETALDLDYLSFATERQARWLKDISEYDQAQAQAKAAGSAKAMADTAMARGKDAVALAESEAQAIEAKGEAQAATVRTQTRFKEVMQASDDAAAIGLKRAGFGARMVAYTGSALDVVRHEENMAEVRQNAISILGGMQVDDIQLDTTLSASLKRQAAHTHAAGLMRDALTQIDEQNLALSLDLTRSRIGASREIALVEEEGWRTALKMKMGSDNTVNRTLMGASNQILQGQAALGSAAAYDAAGDAAVGTGWAKAGTSLLTGASDIYKTAKQNGWFKSTPQASSSGVPGSVRVAANY